MCTYLASKKEATAVNVQLIGIVSNVVVLSQLWYAQVMPLQAFAGVLAASVAISVAGLLYSRGKMTDRSWLPFEALVGAVGVGAAPQVKCCALQSCSKSSSLQGTERCHMHDFTSNLLKLFLMSSIAISNSAPAAG